MNRELFIKQADCFLLQDARDQNQALLELCEHFEQLGYKEHTIAERLEIHNPYQTESRRWPIYNHCYLHSRTAIETVIRLFFLNAALPERDLENAFSRAQIELMHRFALLSTQDGETRAQVSIDPVDDLYIVTDLRFEYDAGAQQLPGRIMYLGDDSVGLTRLAGAAEGRRVLDLCTGSGVAAIQAARQKKSVLGVDINPRAVNFARFNAILNGVEGCHFVQGHLFDPVARDRFDLILANPPFVPSPVRDKLLFRDGGATGEDVLACVVAGLDTHLTETGCCLITSDFVEHGGQDYQTKVRQWLQPMQGYTCALLRSPPMRPQDYALAHHDHQASSDDSLVSWLDHYQHHEITAIRSGYLLMQRSRSPGTRIVDLPMQDGMCSFRGFSGLTESLFFRMDRLNRASRSTAGYRLSSDFLSVELVPHDSALRGMHAHFALVKALMTAPGATAQQLVHWLAEAGYSMSEGRQAAIEEHLEQLYVAGCLELME